MSSELIFDIETTGIDDFLTLDGLRAIHCIGVSDPEGKQQVLYGPDEIERGLEVLSSADVLIGHNILGFDIPAITKLYPDWQHGELYDTLVLSRLVHPDLANDDWAKGEAGIPKNLRGLHSLEAWGHRLDCHKGDYGKQESWDKFTPEMGDYCVQDVEVTRRLYEYLGHPTRAPHWRAVEVEHEFAQVLHDQMRNGIHFDHDAAIELYAKLVERKELLEAELRDAFPPVVTPMKTPEYYVAPDGTRYRTKSQAPAKLRPSLVVGELKKKVVPFNPGSRSMIAANLQDKYGWKPSEYTADGRPKVDETTLKGMDYPEVELLREYLMLAKRLGQLAEGREAYLKLEKGGKLYGKVNHYGTVTGRCTHSRPNLGQVPSVRAPFGKEFRAMFHAPAGWKMVGCDASQLELRCLAHYMNDPDYTRELLSGDIHTRNQKAAGLPTRDLAKVFAYAVCYGAGAGKLGQIVGKGSTEGAKLKKRFLRNVPSLGRLIEKVQAASERGYLIGLLGQHLPVRSPHKALNTLLQGAGASIMKVATLNMARRLAELGDDVQQVAHVHDEVQFCVKEQHAEWVAEQCVLAIRDTTEDLKLRCAMDGEARVGNNWSETH